MLQMPVIAGLVPNNFFILKCSYWVEQWDFEHLAISDIYIFLNDCHLPFHAII
jgi:hypothetical protein